MDANTNTTDQGTQATSGDATNSAVAETPAKLYATRSEAEANKPADAPKSLKVYAVTKDGAVVGFMWGRGYDPCLAALARKDGYSVSIGNTPQVTKETVAARLAEFSDDELLTLGLARKPAKKVK